MTARPLVVLALVLAASTARAQAQATAQQTHLPMQSLYDAQDLGAGRVGFGLSAGFPYVEAVVGYGAADAVDVDLQIDTLYGAATQLGLGPKVRLFGDDGLALALAVQAQWTVFRTPATEETSSGARHVTGLRNFGLTPELVVSTRGRTTSLFAALSYQETYATEGESSGPLGGPLASWGGNLGVHLGGELAPGLSGLVHVFGLIGLDVHLRSQDTPVMPRALLGFTFPG